MEKNNTIDKILEDTTVQMILACLKSIQNLENKIDKIEKEDNIDG